MSVETMASGLRQRGIAFHIVQRERIWEPTYRIPDCPNEEVHIDEIDPLAYRVCLFICGPLPTDWPEGRERLLSFANAQRLAVGTTLASPSSRSAAESVFHAFLARDGFERRWMDLSLSCDWPIAKTELRANEIAVCLRGKEDYFGPDDASAYVEAMFESGLRRRGESFSQISTVLRTAKDDAKVLETQFAKPAGVVTTRLHGTLLALRNRTPWIAIDQVIGGGKVRSINEQLSWPLSLASEELSLRGLERAFATLRDPALFARLHDVRERAIAQSFETRTAALDWVDAALKG